MQLNHKRMVCLRFCFRMVVGGAAYTIDGVADLVPGQV